VKIAIERVIGAGKTPRPSAPKRTTGYAGLNGIVNMPPGDHMGLDSSAYSIAVVKRGD
jgi:hypothetical protein